MKTKIFTGPMWSGKTRKLVTTLEKYVIAKKSVVWFEPKCDTRGGSHGSYIGKRMQELKDSSYVYCFAIESSKEIFQIVEDLLKNRPEENIALICIDEYHMLDFRRQFFYDYCNSNLENIPLIFSGLISGYDSVLLNTAKEVLPFMDEIVKENAICMNCGESANYYNYIGKWKMSARIDTGSNYECLCHKCYISATGKPFIAKESKE